VIDQLWSLIALSGLLLLSSFFSAAQTALSNTRRQVLRDQGGKRAERTIAVIEDSSRALNTFQLANLLATFLTAALITQLLTSTLLSGLLAGLDTLRTLILYLVILPAAALIIYVLTGLLPEILAQRKAEPWAMALAGPARITIALISPIVSILSGIRRQIVGALGGDQANVQVTEEEIMTLVDAGEEEGSIEQDEKEMIYSIFQLDETLAREIMVPRIDIVALASDASLEEAREMIIKAGHSRIPVYEESLDHIKGLLYAKDLLDVWHKGQQKLDIETLLRPPLFVPESKRADDLLRELQNAKVHLAIVVDEYGGTAGLVTIEDIVEEIVGEIIDEYDFHEEAPYTTVGEDEFIFDAGIDLDDFNHLLDTNVPDELSDTLGGFIYAQLGKVPEVGEVVETGALRMEVLRVVNQRIRKVRVKRIPTTRAKPRNGKHDVKEGNSP
jgi:putative hemolysin